MSDAHAPSCQRQQHSPGRCSAYAVTVAAAFLAVLAHLPVQHACSRPHAATHSSGPSTCLVLRHAPPTATHTQGLARTPLSHLPKITTWLDRVNAAHIAWPAWHSTHEGSAVSLACMSGPDRSVAALTTRVAPRAREGSWQGSVGPKAPKKYGLLARHPGATEKRPPWGCPCAL